MRITVPNLPFYILDRGNNRQVVFREEQDFSYFLKLLKRYRKELQFKLYHLCLMPNHIHFLIEPTITGSLPKKLDEGVFGRADFIREMKEKFKIKPLRGRGRPRRDEREKIELTPFSALNN